MNDNQLACDSIVRIHPTALTRSPIGLFERSETAQVLRSLVETVETVADQLNPVAWKNARNAVDAIGQVSEQELTSALTSLAESCWRTRLWPQLRSHRLLYPAYDSGQSYATNLHSPWGPDLRSVHLAGPRRWSVLGHSVDLPIGVPASVLTANSDWIAYWARSGYNVITYKTVRSSAKSSLEPPNWHMAVLPELPRNDGSDLVLDPDQELPWLTDSSLATSVNSYGIPSDDPDDWAADVARALSFLRDDQLLIVSVVGDHEQITDAELLANDFRLTALRAEAAGASVIELNVSCPNVVSDTGVRSLICHDVDLTHRIVDVVAAAVRPSTRLVLKVGVTKLDVLRSLLQSVGTQIDGIAGINAVPVQAKKPDGTNFFPGRSVGALSGRPIYDAATTFAQDFAAIREELNLTLELIAIGGVTRPADVQALFDTGASTVQSATGAALDPSLALQCYEQIYETLPRYPGSRTFNNPLEIEKSIVGAVEKRHGPVPVAELLATRSAPTNLTLEIVQRLVSNGGLIETGPGSVAGAF